MSEQVTGQPSRRRFRPATVAIGVLVAGCAAMWIYAWFLAPRGNVDRFPDRAWSDAAELVCAATDTEVSALPPASSFADVEPKAEALRQRAAVMDEATVLLEGQLATLRATEPSDDKSREGVALWLGDWDSYVQNRRDQADRLRRGDDRPFVVQEQGGAPVTLRMDAFAKANGMPSCVVPDDIG